MWHSQSIVFVVVVDLFIFRPAVFVLQSDTLNPLYLYHNVTLSIHFICICRRIVHIFSCCLFAISNHRSAEEVTSTKMWISQTLDQFLSKIPQSDTCISVIFLITFLNHHELNFSHWASKPFKFKQAWKMRKPPCTLGLKKFGPGEIWVENVLTLNTCILAYICTNFFRWKKFSRRENRDADRLDIRKCDGPTDRPTDLQTDMGRC